jgi:hypothetical protein
VTVSTVQKLVPRKQNGFGNAKSLAFKPSKNINRGKGVGAAGSYPSDRRYGSSVNRTIIEKYDLDSNWVKWRRGFEYYNKGAWYRLKEYDPITQTYSDSQIKSKLYQGTEYEVDVVFDGYKFATKNADSNNHYVMKRTTVSNPDIGRITSVLNDPTKYPRQKANHEIWCKGLPGTQSRLLFQMIGERLTDGETEANLDFILTNDEKPALFIGKSWPEALTEVIAEVNEAVLDSTQWFQERQSNEQELVGKVVYIPQFFVERPVSSPSTFNIADAREYWGVELVDKGVGEVQILDNDTTLPPSLYDISTLDPILSDPAGGYTIEGTYIYKKDVYQRFYGQQYLTGELATDTVDTISYTVMPFVIRGVERRNGKILLRSVPFISELKLYQPLGNNTLIFTDYSFTKTEIDEYNGAYYHKSGHVNDELWMRLDTDVDPWMDEVFSSGNPLQPATIYTCSCPNHSHAMLRAPQDTQDDDTRKINRQRKYPLPTAKGRKDYDQIGLSTAAGRIESWESREHRMSFKMCKHSIATMFIEKLKVKEPNTYPTIDARVAFEEKLDADIAEVGEEFIASYKRGGITTLEVVFALAQGLNLDEVETAYVVLNSNF